MPGCLGGQQGRVGGFDQTSRNNTKRAASQPHATVCVLHSGHVGPQGRYCTGWLSRWVFSKAANAIFQLNKSPHETTWSPSVLLASFVHNLYKPSDRRINNGDHQRLYIHIWHSGDMQLFAKYNYIYNKTSRTEEKKSDVTGQICERVYRTHSHSIELAT